MSRSRFTSADFVIGFFICGFVATFCIAAGGVLDGVNARVQCARNLKEIGMSLMMYANETRGTYPRTTADDANTKPVWGTPYEKNAKLDAKADVDPFAGDFAVAANDVSAPLFLLSRMEDIKPEVFTCPASSQFRWDLGGGANSATHWTNWRGSAGIRDHLSCSYANPYATKDAVAKGFVMNASVGMEFAVVADINPGSDALTKLTAKSSAAELKKGNSPNHAREGQNVLYGDGHVTFETTPFVGYNADNIYTAGKGAKSVVVGSPTEAGDSVLLPTAKDVGLADANGDYVKSMQPIALSPDEAKKVSASLVGKYTRTILSGKTGTMVITPTDLTLAGENKVTSKYKLVAKIGDHYRLLLLGEKNDVAPVNITIDSKGDLHTAGWLDGVWQKVK